MIQWDISHYLELCWSVRALRTLSQASSHQSNYCWYTKWTTILQYHKAETNTQFLLANVMQTSTSAGTDRSPNMQHSQQNPPNSWNKTLFWQCQYAGDHLCEEEGSQLDAINSLSPLFCKQNTNSKFESLIQSSFLQTLTFDLHDQTNRNNRDNAGTANSHSPLLPWWLKNTPMLPDIWHTGQFVYHWWPH